MWFLGPCDFLNCLYLNSNLTLSILLSPVNLSGFQSIVWGIHTYIPTYIHVVTNVHTLLAHTLPRGFSGDPDNAWR